MYSLLVAHGPSGLDALVTHKLDEGWELYGGPVISTAMENNNPYTEYAQAVVKWPATDWAIVTEEGEDHAERETD